MKIIAECGATKTDWCAIYSDGNTLKLRSEGINFAVMSGKDADEIIRKAVMALSSDGEIVSEMHIYAAGQFEKRTGGNVEYDSDLIGAARAVFGHNPGVAAILGTGSNSCMYDGEKIVKNVRSGGFILGDEGSASCLGKLFISDFLKEAVPQDMASDFSASHESDYPTIVNNVYKGVAPSRYLGEIAPWLMGWYGRSDYARNLVDDNFRSFFRRSILQYDIHNYEVGMVGGFAFACKDILTRIASEFGVQISSIVESPIEGLIQYHK